MDKRECDGIEFTREELEDFQRVFPGSAAARLLDKMVVHLASIWRVQLLSCGASDIAVRQAQGAVTVLDDLMNEASKFVQMDIKWDEEVGDEAESDESGIAEGVDVRY